MSARDFRSDASGVDGLSPTEVRRGMRELGWTALLPIHSIDVAEPHKRGKVPSLLKWNERCRFDGRPTTEKDLEGWERREHDAPGTSIACGDIVGIDIDFEADAARGQEIRAIAFDVFGSTPFVRQGRAPKLLLVYQAAEPIGTVKFKAASGTGDGLDVVAEGFHFVAFGLHPKTADPYSWIGTEDPLTAGPEGAPEITQDQVDEFLRRVGEIEALVLTGSSSGGTGGHGGEAAAIARNASGIVTTGREEHLFAIVRTVTHELHDDGLPITAEEITDRAWSRFAASTDLDRPRSSGKIWSYEDVEAKARATVDRLDRGVFSLGSRPSAPAAESGTEGVEPTYTDTAVSLDEARSATREAVRRFYAEAAAWEARKAAHEAREEEAKRAWKAGGRAAAEREAAWFESETVETWKAEGGRVPFRFQRFDEPPPVHLVAPDVGAGKTHAALAAIAEEGRDHKTSFAGPQLRLAVEIAERARDDHGLEGIVIRGRDAEDPNAEAEPGSARPKMCRETDLVAAALALGEDVTKTCCADKVMRDGVEVDRECRFYRSCAYHDQMRVPARLRLHAHQMLAQGHKVFEKTTRVVVDETFVGGLTHDLSGGLTIDEYGRPMNGGESSRLRERIAAQAEKDGDPLDPEALSVAVRRRREDIERRRRMIAAAFRSQVDAGATGPALRSYMVAENEQGAGLTEAIAAQATRDEYDLKPVARLYPGMPEPARREAVAAAAGAKHVRARASIPGRLREFLALGAEKAGRLFVTKRSSDAGDVAVIRTRGIDRISANFEAPTLLLDATPPDERTIRAFYPQAVISERVAVEMPFVRVRQVLGAPTSKTKLKVDLNRRSVRKAILAEWVRLGRKEMLVVAQKPFADWLRSEGKLPGGPSGIAVEHYNNLVGLDRYKHVRGVVCVGREQPDPSDVEGIAGAMTGAYPDVVAAPRAEGKGHAPWYEKAIRGIRMRDGSGRAVAVDVHPDPFVETVRRGVCEDQIVQAIGRARGVWRTEARPLDVLILANVCLDLTVDEVEPWRAATDDVEMAVAGVVLMSAADRARAYPHIWATTKAAERSEQKRREKGAGAESSSPKPYIEYLVGFGVGAFLPIRLKRAGNGQRWAEAFYDPEAVPDPRAWLEARLGPLAGFEIVGPEAETAVAEDVVVAFDPLRPTKTEPAKKSAAPIHPTFDRAALDAALLDFLREDETLRGGRAAA